jgi:hypothetical protein
MIRVCGPDGGRHQFRDAITLSTSAMAFLAGYGVDGVFKALDGLIRQVFQINGTASPAEGAGTQ